MQNPIEKIEHQLLHAVTVYDARQASASVKRGRYYNPHALPQYMERVEAVVRDIRAGADPRAAIVAGFLGALQVRCLKACGLPPADGTSTGDGWSYCPVAYKP